MRTLVTGGVKSGKSRRALDIALDEFTGSVTFLATAEIFDDEMRERVRRHRAERERFGLGFVTVEEPIEIGRAIGAVEHGTIVDCLPMWVNNLMHYGKESDFERILDEFIGALGERCVVVTNETGLGNIPFDENTRRYNLLLAEANRRIAAVSDRVELMVAGIPLRVK